jgi:hypothetical protein
LPPFPERNVPFFLRCSALFTDLLAALPYLAIAYLHSGFNLIKQGLSMLSILQKSKITVAKIQLAMSAFV